MEEHIEVKRMNELLLVSILVFVLMTYKQLRALRNKEIPRGNRRIVWSIYSFSVIGLVVVNIYFS